MIICWHCNTSLLDGTIFCDTCGAALLEGAPRLLAPPLEITPARAETPSVEPRLILATTGVTIPLPLGPEVIVGRIGDSGPTPDVDLGPFRAAAAGVSRAHIALNLAGPSPRIEDLDSTNGTYVNGKRITPRHPVPLYKGDQIYLGQLAMRLEL